ncbi:MAG TPA: SLC13 family permease [Acidimicrobiales bacterium]|nr:SLC13 family permease [Acidimicrobiales bacterium]
MASVRRTSPPVPPVTTLVPDRRPPPWARVRGRVPAAWVLAGVGGAGAGAAALLDAGAARRAAAQDWSPFVLVAGLLLVGLVADEDGLFARAGTGLARLSRRGPVVFGASVVLVALVTSVLNLDTSVAFLTPVLVHTARRRRPGAGDDTTLVVMVLLVSNAASLLLPGANLTNLIVLGHLHLSGRVFLARAAPASATAVVVTALVVGLARGRSRGPARAGPVPDVSPEGGGPGGTGLGIGAAAVAAVAVLVVAVASPALPVVAVGVVAVVLSGVVHGRPTSRALPVLGLPVLVGLLGVAVALGTVGRAWSGPAQLLSHLDAWGTAALGALASVTVNNLPAASLLAARVPPRPLALLVGLDIGPNLFLTGSLSWVLWRQAAVQAGARAPVARAAALGLLSAPAAGAAALAVLGLMGTR